MISRYIKSLREKQALTQEFMAAELGLSRPTYAQIEKGERELTVNEAKKIAALFDISLDDFLAEKQENLTVAIEEKNKKLDKNEETGIRIDVPQEKADKFRQVLLYVLKKAGGKPNVGMTVLYKILYFIDFDYYEKYEEQLMGALYIKNHHGPTPVMFEKIVEGLIRENRIELIKSKYYQYPQTKYMINPNVEPDLSVIDGREKEHIDWELDRLSNMTATEISRLSHKDIPWITGAQGKPMDYEAVFYRTDDTSVREYGEEDPV
jgi:transcriptional regulator with XRE-family HTH domain